MGNWTCSLIMISTLPGTTARIDLQATICIVPRSIGHLLHPSSCNPCGNIASGTAPVPRTRGPGFLCESEGPRLHLSCRLSYTIYPLTERGAGGAHVAMAQMKASKVEFPAGHSIGWCGWICFDSKCVRDGRPAKTPWN